MKAELSWYKKCRQVLPIIIISICNLTTYLVVLSIYMNTKSHLFLSNLCSSNGSHAGSLFNKENQKKKNWLVTHLIFLLPISFVTSFILCVRPKRAALVVVFSRRPNADPSRTGSEMERFFFFLCI